jgi:nitroreductase/dihydropteridine reductase
MDISRFALSRHTCKAYDSERKIPQDQVTGVVLAALGFRSEDDFNAKLPKSRLPMDEAISEM